MRSHWAAGQAKLKGKKRKLLSCGCCVVKDFRGKVTDSCHKREMGEAVKGVNPELLEGK